MEPKWLIGGPDSPEKVTVPQQDTEITELIEILSEGTYEGKTAAQWRDQATRSRQQSLNSFARSDTDGALSQLASDSYARKCNLCAELAEKDGWWEFPALFTLTGALVPDARYVKTSTEYGGKWVWRIGTGPTAQWFNESKALNGSRRRKNDAAKGFAVGTIRARAHVATSGTGRGSGGMLSIGYYIRQDDHGPIEVIDDGRLGTQYQDY